MHWNLIIILFCLTMLRQCLSFQSICSKIPRSSLLQARSFTAKSFKKQTGFEPFHGMLAVYKPMNISSNDVVQRIKKILIIGAKEEHNRFIEMKVGHGGTLDVMAHGVLVLGIGKGTKLLNKFLAGPKKYRTWACLGEERDSYDVTGTVLHSADCSHISLDILKDKLQTFLGETEQKPPIFSALRVNGTRAYDLARSGQQVDLKSRLVTTHSLTMLSSTEDLPNFAIDIECGGGFYVRSLISDLGRACGGYAYMTDLVRTKHGQFTEEDALKEEDWSYAKLKIALEHCNAKADVDFNNDVSIL